MKNIYLSILFFFCIFKIEAQQWEWLSSIQNGGASLYGITTIDNDIYSVCFARDTIYFPQFHTTILPQYSFLVKTGEQGNIIWVRKLGSTWANKISDNSIDIFIAETQLPDNEFIYLSSYDTSGNLKWMNTIANANNCYSTVFDLETDANGNTLILTHIPSWCTPFSSGTGNTILSKYNFMGQLAWSDTLDSTIHFPYLHVDLSGNIYLSGVFRDSVTFHDAANSWSYNSSSGAFLLKLNSALYIDWFKIIPTSFSYPCFPTRVITDSQDNVYLPIGTQTHFTCDNITFQGSAVIKFAPSGIMNSYLYTGTGTPTIKYMSDNTIGIYGNTFSIGSHKFIKADTSLNVDYLFNILFHHTWGTHEAYFDSDLDGNFLIGGYTCDTLSFSNSSVFLPMLDFYNDQVYYAKYGTAISLEVPSIINPQNGFSIFPNPNNGTFTIQRTKQTELKIYTSFGQLIHHQIIKSQNQQIDLSGQPKGIYIVEAGNERRKIVLN